MTKEEQLKEEAENKLDEWSDPDMGCEEGYCYSEVADFMFRFAEPREKRIAELEAKNELLEGRNEGFEQQIMGLLIKYEEVYKRFPDLKSAMDKAQTILKENAELKERCNILDESLVTSTKNNIERQKIIDELKNRDCWKTCEYANPKSELIGQHIKDVQDLSKAKEIIKKIEKVFYSGENALKRLSKISDIFAEAETFLKDSEVDK